jgi:putative ABC transport system permease protein
LRVRPGTDPDVAEHTVRAAIQAALPRSPVSITRGDEETAQRILYRDARNDQKVFLTLAILVLAGAAVAAFNLISRVVEAQRREIGIGMALGVEPRMLALRPIALAVQIALLGVLLSIPLGLGLSAWLKELLKDYFPLPVYASTFPTGLFALASGVGVAIPLLAASIPVRRAVRVAPIEAIRIGFRAAKGTGASRLLSRLPVPGRSLARLPVRNVARAPLRTVLTVLGLAGVITAIVAVLGMVDAIRDVADRQEAEVLSASPSRLNVQLAGLEPAHGPLVGRLSSQPGVAAHETTLSVASQLRSEGAAVDAALTFLSLASPVWRPSVAEGGADRGGILLSRRAAEALGVSPGDSIALRHPRRVGRGLVMTETRVRVAGLHGSPLRAIAYMDVAAAAGLGLGGVVNGVTLVPEPGRATSLERALFGQPGVASVRPASSDTEALRTTVSSFTEAIQIVGFITLALGVLVAFTTVSVSVDERRREYATMFAFGFPPRSGLRVTVVESLIIGLLGTAAGIGLGLVAAAWIVGTLIADTFPDLGAETALTGGSVLLALGVGLLAVTTAPLLTFRRMRSMDVPSTLRVVE